MNAQKRCVVLLSGGVDSSTSAAIAGADGYEVYALTILYGQRHKQELESARTVSKALGIKEHKIIELDLSLFGGSALTSDMPVPKGRDTAEMASGIPSTYVPARNTIFLSLALAWAEVLGTGDIFIGANAVDYSGYPDCRPEYLEAFERMATLATKAGVEGQVRVKVHAPLLRLTKGQIIRKGLELGLDYGITHSCYDPLPDGRPCGACDSCILRAKGFEEAGRTDPVLA
ncbi:MAG: 7-cyano-7-deazaguanine synthase QueC [Nitrospirota bacterium]|nr:7-cyano-7-deazaguanine synthase QueC [Nitrospirota bacterium]